MNNLTMLKDWILLIKDLPKSKGGVFVIGVLVSSIPCFLIYTWQDKYISREIIRYEKEHERLNTRLDTCNAKADRAYLKGIEENINKDLLPAKAYKKAVDDIEKDMVKEEVRILNRIKRKQDAIQKEMNVEI